ncbi:MAG TPA: LysR family transcriptional regulator [Rugosimonospora sp.]|nr:LysR family transcriptional regulator [Rugosimonospora sp.]
MDLAWLDTPGSSLLLRRSRRLTPTQLRAYAAVVRLGSVKHAAADLEVSEAAVSLHIGQLRKELGDRLFVRTVAGLAFTPGGLRLASRATEMLSLQDRTIIEVRQAGGGRRMLRMATSPLFAEYSAPGLIELFADRANDLDVELSDHDPGRFESLLLTRSVDAAIGPRPARLGTAIAGTHFLNYQVVAVAAADHPMAGHRPAFSALRDQTWLLGPSAAYNTEVVPNVLRTIGVPETRQRIYQSHAAAVEEAKRGKGLALVVAFAVSQDLVNGDLVRIHAPALQVSGAWSILTLTGQPPSPEAAELVRFITTPRATQAMLRGSGATVGRFKPSIHVTLWS